MGQNGVIVYGLTSLIGPHVNLVSRFFLKPSGSMPPN